MVSNVSLYGVGKGNAQIINNGGLLNNLGQLIARQQAQRQAEIKMLADQQAQLKPAGLRNDADRKDFFDQVNNWRSQAVQAQNERDPYKKAQLKAQADQAYLQAQDLVSKSKQRGDMENQFGMKLLDDNFRHQFTDDAATQFVSSKNVGVNDPSLIDFNNLGRQVDHTKVISTLDKADQTLLKQSQWGTPTMIRKKVGNQNATFLQNQRAVDENSRATQYQQMYEASPDVKKFFNDLYDDIHSDPNLSIQQKRDASISRYIKQSGPVHEFSQPVEKVDRKEPVDPFYEHQEWLRKHPKAGSEGFDDGRDEFVNAVQTNDKDATDQLVRAVARVGGKLTPTKEGGLTFKIPQTKYINETDPTSGKMVKKAIVEDKLYHVSRDGSAGSIESLNNILNQTDLFAKRALYKKKENQYGSGNTPNPKSESPTKKPNKKADPLGLF